MRNKNINTLISDNAKNLQHSVLKLKDEKKILIAALSNLLKTLDDEGWNNQGEDWPEQLDARMILSQLEND